MFANSNVLMYDPNSKKEYYKPIRSVMAGDYVISNESGDHTEVLHCGVGPPPSDTCVAIPRNYFGVGLPSEEISINGSQRILNINAGYTHLINAADYEDFEEITPEPCYYMLLDDQKYFNVSNIFILPMSDWPSSFVDNSLAQVKELPRITELPQENLILRCPVNSSPQDVIEEFAPLKPAELPTVTPTVRRRRQKAT